MATAKHGADTKIKFENRDLKEPGAEAAKGVEVVILAAPHGNADDPRAEVKPYVDGKTVIDVMNALGPNMERDISCTTSTAEETQMKLPSAHAVKTFNTVFAPNQSTIKIVDQQLNAFIGENNEETKRMVMQLTRDMGFDPVDCGPLKTARSLEVMGNMLINLGLRV